MPGIVERPALLVALGADFTCEEIARWEGYRLSRAAGPPATS